MNFTQKFFGRMAGVATIGLVAASFGLMWGYLPPYSWFAEIQLAIMGEYYESIALLLTVVTLIFAVLGVLLACKILWKKVQGPRAPIAPTALIASIAPRTSTPAAPIAPITPWALLPRWFDRGATIIILVGLGFVVFGGYNYFTAKNAGALTELDLSQLEAGQATPTPYVRVRGMALDKGTVTFGTSGNMDAYTPLVSGQQKFPPTIFLKAHTDNAVTGQVENLNAPPANNAAVFEGMLKANDLPGPVRTEYQRVHAIADTYYVLEVGQTPATQMGGGKIMAVVGGIIVLFGFGVWAWNAFRDRKSVLITGAGKGMTAPPQKQNPTTRQTVAAFSGTVPHPIRSTNQPKTGPSVMLGAFLGYALATVLGIIIALILAISNGKASATGAMDILVGFGACGAFFGYGITFMWRRSRGVSDPKDQWNAFILSPRAWLLGALVIVGSFVLAMTIALGFNAIQNSQRQDPPQAAPTVQAPPVANNTQNRQIPAPPVQPASPPDEPTAETLKKIASTWQRAGTDPVELLATMHGPANRSADGTTTLHPGQRLSTSEHFTVPVAFRIVAQTHGGDTRIRFPANQIIFNWEMNRDELRVDGGPASGRHKPGAGRLPDDQWVGIELVVLRDEMVIYVDGAERYRTSADFSKIDAPFQIWSQSGAPLKIHSITKIRL